MIQQELLEYGLTFEDSCADTPFKTATITVLRHKSSGKWFALLLEQKGRPCVNLKCDPQKADFWRSVYKSVTPGYHMNKRHWNTVDLNGDVPLAELHQMLADSFMLTS